MREVTLTTSSGRKALVTFKRRQIGPELRVVVDISWDGTSTPEDRKEADIALHAMLVEQSPDAPVYSESRCVESDSDRLSIAKKHLGIGEN